MAGPLRLDRYLLARPAADGWRAQWCAAARTPSGAWRFDDPTAALLPARDTDAGRNRYFETLGPDGAGRAALDLAARQLEEFLPAPDGALDLVIAAGHSDAQLECLLGVLKALGHAPRHLLPRALAAAAALPPGRHRLLELGLDRSFVSTVEVGPERTRLAGEEPYAELGLCALFGQWLEAAAAAFAARLRYNLHRNLNASRRELYAQLRTAFAVPDPESISLECAGHAVELEAAEFAAELPARLTGGDDLRLLPPLPSALPLPAGLFGLAALEDPAPAACRALLGRLEAGDAPRLHLELPA